MVKGSMKHSKRLVLLFLLVLPVLVACNDQPASSERGPIAILGDGDFTARNGVRSGSGTLDDPYVISGWEIEVGTEDTYGVQIENVTAFFVLKGLVIEGASDADGAAIRIGLASGGRIEECTIVGSRNGIQIVSSTDITMSRCLIYGNGRGLRVDGETAAEYRHDIDESNLYNDRSIVYLVGLDGETVEGHTTGHLTVADSRDVTVQGNTVIDGDGIMLAFVDDSTVVGNATGRNTPVLNDNGIHLYQSSGNTVMANHVQNTRLSGIQLSLSTDNEISYNRFAVCDSAVRLLASDRNTIRLNEAVRCVTGFWITGGSADNTIEANVIEGKGLPNLDSNTSVGIFLESGSRNLFDRNGLSDCETGLQIDVSGSANRIVANTIVACGYGISIAGSANEIERNLLSQSPRAVLFPETFTRSITRGNTFRGNVFADNASHVYTNLDSTETAFTENVFLGQSVALISDQGTGNVWTVDGVGNYWRGETLEDANGDGIGDEPVKVYPSGVDDEAPLVSVDPREVGLGILGTLSVEQIALEDGDGASMEIDVLRAVGGTERWVGFRGFPEVLLDGFPGILFEFEAEAERRFVMMTVPFDLDIAFFDAEGRVVGIAEMEALSQDYYGPQDPAMYVLELPAGSFDELGITAETRLLVP